MADVFIEDRPAELVPARARKGRGAITNRVGRFEPHEREAVDDGWPDDADEELPPLRTTVAIDATRTIIARNDSYGVGLRDDTTAALQEAGVEVVETQTYSEDAQTFDAEVGALAAADPDAILVIGFDESSRILTQMIEEGIGPDAKAVYGCDGNIGNALGVDFDAGN